MFIFSFKSVSNPTRQNGLLERRRHHASEGGENTTDRPPGREHGDPADLTPEHPRSAGAMEWATVQHLDLRHAGGRRGASARPMQQHAAAFRPSQAIVAVAIGTHVVGTYSRPSYLPLPSFHVRVGELGLGARAATGLCWC
jgi:hypothetical protein